MSCAPFECYCIRPHCQESLLLHYARYAHYAHSRRCCGVARRVPLCDSWEHEWKTMNMYMYVYMYNTWKGGRVRICTVGLCPNNPELTKHTSTDACRGCPTRFAWCKRTLHTRTSLLYIPLKWRPWRPWILHSNNTHICTCTCTYTYTLRGYRVSIPAYRRHQRQTSRSHSYLFSCLSLVPRDSDPSPLGQTDD